MRLPLPISNRLLLVLLALAGASPMTAAPKVFYGGVLNAASYSYQGLPNSSLARGSIFTIFGTDLGPATLTEQPSYPLTTTLAGVSVEIRKGATKVAAIPIMVSASQINAVMPSNAPLGEVGISVTYNGSTSNFASATVVSASSGIFVITQTDGSATQPENPARRGLPVTIWGTGLGPVPNDSLAPSAGDLPTQVEVIIGGRVTSTLYKGRSPCCSGLDQIVALIPDNAPLGCFVPIQLRLSGSLLSNTVSIPIAEAGRTCDDAQTPVQNLLSAGGKNGLILLSRTTSRDVLTSLTTLESTSTLFTAAFLKALGSSSNPLVSLPPPGTCMGFTAKGGPSNLGVFSLFLQLPSLGSELDAGQKLTVQSVAAPRRSLLPLFYTGGLDSTHAWTPGAALTISGTGGADVGAFSTTVQAPVAFDFNERTTLWNVARANPLGVSWTPTSGTVLVTGFNFVQALNATAGFMCTANASDGTFSVPAYILQNLPAAPPVGGLSDGWLAVSLVRTLADFTAPGLDKGVVVGLSLAAKSILFR